MHRKEGTQQRQRNWGPRCRESGHKIKVSITILCTMHLNNNGNNESTNESESVHDLFVVAPFRLLSQTPPTNKPTNHRRVCDELCDEWQPRGRSGLLVGCCCFSFAIIRHMHTCWTRERTLGLSLVVCLLGWMVASNFRVFPKLVLLWMLAD